MDAFVVKPPPDSDTGSEIEDDPVVGAFNSPVPRDLLESPYNSQNSHSDTADSGEVWSPYRIKQASTVDRFIKSEDVDSDEEYGGGEKSTSTSRDQSFTGRGEDWNSEAEKRWRPKIFPFTAQPGPINAAAELDSRLPMDFLSLFLTDDVLKIIVDQTNIYAEQCLSQLVPTPHSRAHKWIPLTLAELKTFLALFFLTGIVWKPDIALYWARDTVHDTPFFGRTMSRNRFQLIFRFLHFNDQPDTGIDRLYKIRPVVDYLVTRFESMYQPSQDISIDEGTLLWRGRLGFKVYNPMKPAKYGIKSYILCDSKTGYCYNIRPYCGQYSSLSDTVHCLTRCLVDQGYQLFMDNYYNSVALCSELLEKKIHFCGTIRPNRGCAVEIQNASNSTLGIGDRIAKHKDGVMVLAWRDNTVVRMVTTFHMDNVGHIDVGRRAAGARVTVPKPECVLHYNRSMNGVDKLDQNISYYPCIRKVHKWTNKYMFYLFQICLYNSFVLYRARHPQTSIDMMAFIVSVVEGWTGRLSIGMAPDPRSARPSTHTAVPIPPTAKKKSPTNPCVMCRKRSAKRSESRYRCNICLVPLHRRICFAQYHTEVDCTAQSCAR